MDKLQKVRKLEVGLNIATGFEPHKSDGQAEGMSLQCSARPRPVPECELAAVVNQTPNREIGCHQYIESHYEFRQASIMLPKLYTYLLYLGPRDRSLTHCAGIVGNDCPLL